MEYGELLSLPPYSQNKAEKIGIMTERLRELTVHHLEQCPAYRRMMTSVGLKQETLDQFDGTSKTYYDLPFLPVRLFKEMDLRSVGEEEVSKTMTSSGTTGQAVSRIYLDRATAANQQKVMVRIVSDFTGSERMPMLIIDCPSVVNNRVMFSARGAGILGFSIFGVHRTYALDDDMRLDVEAVRAFLDKHQGQRILLFGFTFMIWQHFYHELVRLQEEENIRFDFSNAIMIHGGGWKKLASQAVNQEDFQTKLREICGLKDIHDYYGMVEQTGCIYMQCEYGHLHASVFSDIIVRDPLTFRPVPHGTKGIVQVVSVLPESYPGHSLLTEDEGIVLGEDDCPCGRMGKYFKILGRLKDAEIRGCSDTYGEQFK